MHCAMLDGSVPESLQERLCAANCVSQLSSGFTEQHLSTQSPASPSAPGLQVSMDVTPENRAR
jgi:hypothetical protein